MTDRVCTHCGKPVTRRSNRGPWPKWCDEHRDPKTRQEPVRSAPVGVAGAAGTGDRVAALRALRDRLAAEIDECDSARDLAALSRQLTDVLGQLAEFAPAVREVSPLDELAERRRKSS